MTAVATYDTKPRYLRLLVMFISLHISSQSFGWGEHGHDYITRAAVRLLPQQKQAEPLFELLRTKEHLLAHYANTPDIVWRGGAQGVRSANSPTHFFDLEYLGTPVYPVKLAQLPLSMDQVVARIEKNCKSTGKNCPPGKSIVAKLSKVGSAPFRVNQLISLMESQMTIITKLTAARTTKKGRQAYNQAVDQMLLYAGLASHFVGDLSNPNHCTRNYDGKETGNGGIHSYFESQLVKEADLTIVAEIIAQGSRSPQIFDQEVVIGQPQTYLEQSWYMVYESFRHNPQLFQLDRDFAFVNKKPKATVALPARLSPAQVLPQFRAFLVQRLANGAQTLSRLWYQAWVRGGKPDFEGYQSFHYDTSPTFVKPNYLPGH